MNTKKSIGYLLINLVVISMFIQNLSAQDTSVNRDTIQVKYVFWSSPRYVIGRDQLFKNTNNNFTGTLKPDFKALFHKDSDEYIILRKSANKITVGNFAFAVPGAICLCFATISKDKTTRNSLILGGSAFLIVDISLGISGFKDLKNAARIRNKRITYK